MSTSSVAAARQPALLICGRRYPVVLPKLSDPRLHLAAAIVSLQVLGQTALHFQLSIAQILVSVGTCAALEIAIVLRRQKALVWPASALLTGNGVSFILRVPGTEHGDWWSLHGGWIFAAAAAAGLLSKHVIRFGGRHVFNPSNFGLVLCFLALGDTRAQPLDFWWGPMSPGLAAAIAIIVVAGLAILARLRMLVIAAGFWVSFAAGVAILTASGHAITARWHLGPISGWSYWWLLVSSPEILVFLFFMITDPRTTPSGTRARGAFAVAVGLLAALLVAPQSTEFATKVAVLSALAVVCAARPLLSLGARALEGRRGKGFARPGTAISLAGATVYALVLVGAGVPARPGSASALATASAQTAGIDVTIARTRSVSSSIPHALAVRIAAEVVTGLRVQAEALRWRNPSRAAGVAGGAWLAELRALVESTPRQAPIRVSTYNIEHVLLTLAAGPDQTGPRVFARVRGTVEEAIYTGVPARLQGRSARTAVDRTFELAGGANGYRIVDASPAVGTAPSASVSVSLSEINRAAVPLGKPAGLTATIRNADDASRPVTLELTVADRAGRTIPFSAARVIVPGRGRATRRIAVTPSQWFASPGRFRVSASVDGRPAGSVTVNVSKPDVTVPIFADVSRQAGLDTRVPAPGCGQFSNGAAWGDINGDGSPDLFLTRLGQPAQLFVSDGKGHFRDEAARRGVAVRGAVAAAFGDYDNDGRPDLFVARSDGSVLFHNAGRGEFVDVTARAGIHDDAPGTSVAWGDFDNDGRLDVYVASYVTCIGKWRDPYALTSKARYYPDALYRNNGDGTFTLATSRLGGQTTNGAGLAAAWFDYDGDGRPDLYLGNDFIGEQPDHNRLWRNTPSGFRDVSMPSATGLFANTMGIAVGDFDRDLRLDLALSDIGAKKLLLNRGDGRFTDVASSWGVARPRQRVDVPSITWGVGSYDFNLDGWEDLYFAAGNILQANPAGAQPDELYVNDGTGRRFLDLSAPSRGDIAGDTKGLAFADYDGDGRIDIAAVDQTGAPKLLRNVTPRGRDRWLEVTTRGTVSNRDGCGARVLLRLTNGVRMLREVQCAGNQALVHFGLGPARVAELEVLWPSGIRQRLQNVQSNRSTVVTEPRRATEHKRAKGEG